MLDKLAGIEARYEELNRLMAEGAADYSRITEYARERSGLEEIVAAYREYQTVLKDLAGARQLLEDASLAESISLLKHQETVYQAVLEVGRRALPPSLFDFLR